MNYVEPIRSKDDIDMMSEYLKEWDERNYILFLIGINTGLRIADILRLRVCDVRGWYIVLKEKKTKKVIKRKLNNKLKKVLDAYCYGKRSNEPLIKSRNGYNKSITREMAYLIIKTAATDCGIENIGTHSMRKTFGYHHYQKHKDIGLLMEMFNHSSPAITKRYIGINQDSQDRSLAGFSLGI